MTTYGVTSTGFLPKRLADITSELNASLQAGFGPSINLDPTQPLGQIVGIMAEREALVWGVAQDVYNSAYPDMASGVSLDNAVALTGVTRKKQTFSKVAGVIFQGTAGTVIAQGALAAVSGNTTSLFATDTALTIQTPVVEVQTVSFAGGTPASGSWSLTWNGQTTTTLSYLATAAQVQTGLRALTNPVTGSAPTGLAAVTVTGSQAAGFVVTFTGTVGLQPLLAVTNDTMLTGSSVAVTGSVAETTPGSVTTGSLTATAPGPVAAPCGALTVIQSPTAGWLSVINPAAAVAGQVTETDSQLKLRRVQALRSAGSSTVQAIQSAIIALSGVTACLVFENVTATVDGAGRPAKSFETVVQGGTAQTIANTIWTQKPAGIQTYGNQTSTVVDSQGSNQTINWSRPTAIPIYVTVTLTKTAAFPTNGAALVQAQVLAYGATLTLGSTVVPVPGMVAFLASIPGIIGAVIQLGTAPSPSGTSPITISQSQIATFSLANITVA